MPADGGNAERARLLSLSPQPPPPPPFPDSLAHNFVVSQSHSTLNLLCDQRFHASTLFRFKTATAFFSSQYIVLREYISHYAFLSKREHIQGQWLFSLTMAAMTSKLG